MADNRKDTLNDVVSLLPGGSIDTESIQESVALMTTSTVLGVFRSGLATRMEFLDHISRGAEKLNF